MPEINPPIQPQDSQVETNSTAGTVVQVNDTFPITHINAYYQDVEDAKAAVGRAKGALEEAVQRLESHPDYVAPEESESSNEPQDEPDEKSKKTTKKSKKIDVKEAPENLDVSSDESSTDNPTE